MLNQNIHHTHLIETDGNYTHCSRCNIEGTIDQWNEAFGFPCVPHYAQFISFTKEGELKVETIPEKDGNYQYTALCCMENDSFESGVIAGIDVMTNLLRPFFELGVLALCEAVAETNSLQGMITEFVDIGALVLEPVKLLEFAQFIGSKVNSLELTDEDTRANAIEAWKEVDLE
jgi:hypothetical protein